MENIIETLKIYSEQSGIYTSFDYGEDIELNLTGKKNYPQLFLEEPLNISLTDGDFLTFEFALLMLDYENTDKDYKSDTPKIQKFVNSLRPFSDYLESKGYVVSKPFTALTLRNFSSDECCGLRVELSVKYLKKC